MKFKLLNKIKHKGALTVEVGLIFCLVIAIGYFFLPQNGLIQSMDRIVDKVLGRVTSDTGNYQPSGLGVVPEIPESHPEIKDPTALGIVRDAVRDRFSVQEYKKNQGDTFENIISVSIIEHENGTRELLFLSNTDGKWKTANSFFKQGHHEQELLAAMQDVPAGEYKMQN